MKLRIIGFAALILLMGCSKGEYQKMVERERASGERHDEIFLGIHLGMSSKDFYQRCWELNKEKILRQGMGNSTVLYYLKDDLKDEAALYFYPEFYDDKIYQMPMTIEYLAWAPWNKDLFADTLMVETKDLFEEWYGEGFIELTNKAGKRLFVKVDGNRRITIFRKSDRKVEIKVTDLLIEEQIKKEADASVQK
jgi:hypothetical protein